MENIKNHFIFNLTEQDMKIVKTLFDISQNGELLVSNEIKDSKEYKSIIDRALSLGLITKKGKAIRVYATQFYGYGYAKKCFTLRNENAFNYLFTNRLPDFLKEYEIHYICVVDYFTFNYSSYDEFEKACSAGNG